MTQVLLITYTLRNKLKDYSPLYQAIKGNGSKWWHYIDTAWIVQTVYSADQFAHKLYPHIEQADYLLVVKITRDHQGWMPKEAWDWLNSLTY
jgi:hypothetical protein